MKLSEILGRIDTAARSVSKSMDDIKLIAVSKNVDTDAVEALHAQGQIAFGENRVQELKRKSENLCELPLEWHFIGTLQTNKINHLLSLRPALWQSCNSIELARAVDKRLSYIQDTLLEINCADEASKSGIEISRAIEEYLQIKEECKNLNICGVMSIGAHSDDKDEIKKSFEVTFKIFESLEKYGAKICSMGMSDDFELAIQNGSNMVRLGRILSL